MNYLKKIFDFYIFSNIHVALAGFCITKISLINYGYSESLTPLFVALSIIFSYNFIRMYEIKYVRLNWLRKWFFEHKLPLLILAVIAFLGLFIIVFYTNFNKQSIYILFPFFLMTFFYVIPIFKIGEIEISFRNFPAIKILSIAIAWAGITVLFPLFEIGYGFTNTVYIEFFQRILFIIAITIPFDIRDVKTDSKTLKTLPQLVGVHNSKYIGIGFLIVFLGIEFFKQPIFKSELIVTVCLAIITTLFLLFSSENKSRYYTSFWVEAIPIFWLFLIYLF
ncbi:hypothetical protein MHL31_15925 [Lutibacter sp. A80]|uniref:hypothetical protein n=1 Tax=Lutibacter sp. A80 TaxID=2918453 RepID=UPI001F056FAD|nr:hypothetical protein [Lutibacter sp. A80]UMB60552.1 hypothetical protein MHL31_15925 [Lutibacter sp. A80]